MIPIFHAIFKHSLVLTDKHSGEYTPDTSSVTCEDVYKRQFVHNDYTIIAPFVL